VSAFSFCTLFFLFVAQIAWAQTPTVSKAPQVKRQSSYELMSPATREMQDDETLNPATFWVLDGQTLWNAPAGKKMFRVCNVMGTPLPR
jgi:hypothetical protein